jgi:hypothetical protein
MSRRPKPPPMVDLQVQGLSAAITHKAIERDDFTGEFIEVIKVVQPAPAVITNRRKYERESKLAQRKEFIRQYVAQRDAAHAVILQRREAKLHTPAQPGQRVITLGSGLVITDKTKPIPPWRRL